MALALRQIFSNLRYFTRCTPLKLNPPAISSIAPKFCSSLPTPYEIVNAQEDRKSFKGKIYQNTINIRLKPKIIEIIDKVSHQIATKEQGRLFAVVHVAGKQFKITQGDLIVIEGYWPPEAGDKITLDKVLLLGASDFTLIGRPLVQRGLVQVTATVIEKTLSHTKTHFRKKRRKQYMRIHCKDLMFKYLLMKKF